MSPQRVIHEMPTSFFHEVYDWLFGVRCAGLWEPNTWEQDLSGLTWHEGRGNATEMVEGAVSGQCKIASNAADYNLLLAIYTLTVLIWLGLVASGLCIYFAARLVWALWMSQRARLQRQQAQQT